MLIPLNNVNSLYNMEYVCMFIYLYLAVIQQLELLVITYTENYITMIIFIYMQLVYSSVCVCVYVN